MVNCASVGRKDLFFVEIKASGPTSCLKTVIKVIKGMLPVKVIKGMLPVEVIKGMLPV